MTLFHFCSFPPCFLCQLAAAAASFIPRFVKGFILQLVSLLILIIKLEPLLLDINNFLCQRTPALLAEDAESCAALGVTGTANIAGAQ